MFLTKLQSVFKEWYPSIIEPIKLWRAAVEDGVDEDDISRYYIQHALFFAYQGVANYLNSVHKHRESLR